MSSQRPWRVRYEWADGHKGMTTRSTKYEADVIAAEIERAAVLQGRAVKVQVVHRDADK
jgi:hypothetical protein